MPNPMLEVATQSIELEHVNDMLVDLVPTFDDDYNFFKSRAKKVPISNATAAGSTANRPAWRVPMVIQDGGPIVTGTGDQTSLLRGTGSTTAAFALNPCGYWGITEWSYLSEVSTEGKDRATVELSTELIERSLRSFTNGISAQINGPGVASGTIAIIPPGAYVSSASGTGNSMSYITGITNAASFQDQQVVQFFSQESGTNYGSATVSMSDPVAQIVYFSTAIPGGVGVGTYIIISGASGAQGTGLANIQYWDVNSNTGTVGGLSRSNYPGRLSTPTINLNSAQITPTVFQRAEVLALRAMGTKGAETFGSAVWYGAPDQLLTQAAQWYERMITQNLEKGDEVPEIARKNLNKKFGGRDFHQSLQAPLNRVELLMMDNWYFGELQEVGLWDFGGGNTIMPVPDVGTTNGTYLTDRMFAYKAFFQLCNSAPRHGCYIQNASVISA